MSKSKSPSNPQPGATLSLSDVLKTNTEAFIPQPVIDEVAVDITPEKPDFIEPQPAPQPQPGPAPHNPAMGYQQPGPQYQQQYQEAEPEAVSLSPRDIAIIAVNLFDGIQQGGFTLFSKMMLFNDEEKELLKNMDTTANTVYNEGSKEAIIMTKWRKHINTMRELPFSEGEKQRLQDAGIIYAETMNVKVTPLQGLIAAFSEVVVGRGLKIFNSSL